MSVAIKELSRQFQIDDVILRAIWNGLRCRMLLRDRVTAVRGNYVHQYYVEYHFAPLPAFTLVLKRTYSRNAKEIQCVHRSKPNNKQGHSTTDTSNAHT